MKRFRFRLETVLGHRRALLRERQRELAEARAACARMEQAIFSMDARRRECQEQIRRAARGRLERVEMLRMRSYVNALWLEILSAGSRLAKLRAQEEERRRTMVRARQDVRALERLREKALDAWRREAGRQERRFLDDLRPAASLLVPPTSSGGEA